MPDLSILKKEGASCTELMECFFNLGQHECEAFYAVASREKVTLDELSEIINRDRSTTHRLLQKLVGEGLCYKEKTVISRGGYIHVYSAVSIPRITQQLNSRIDGFMEDLKRILPNVESDLRKNIEKIKLQQ